MVSLSSTTTLPALQLVWVKRHDWMPGEEMLDLATPACAFWMVERGEIELDIKEGPIGNYARHWKVPAESCFLTPEPTIRDIRAIGESGARWLSLGLRISGPAFPREFHHLLERLAPVPTWWKPEEVDRATVSQAMESLIQVWGTNDVGPAPHTASGLLCQGLALAILGGLWRSCQGESLLPLSPPTALPPWLVRVLAFIEAEPATTLDELTRASGVSSAQFRRGFARYLGSAPNDYLRAQRLEKARFLLISTERTVAQIAASVGFESQPHLTRCYGAVYGMPPAAHRRALRAAGV